MKPSVASIIIYLENFEMSEIVISPQRKAKINWNCRRGMLELDVIFERFSKKYLDDLTDEQLVAFEDLLTYPDPDLFAWLMGYEDPEQEGVLAIVAFIRLHDNI